MNVQEAYHGINARIRYLEDKRDRRESKGTSHVLHLLLTIVTFGAWLVVWIFLGLFNFDLSKPAYYAEIDELYVLKYEAERKLYGRG